jgi:hypothetical protein
VQPFAIRISSNFEIVRQGLSLARCRGEDSQQPLLRQKFGTQDPLRPASARTFCGLHPDKPNTTAQVGEYVATAEMDVNQLLFARQFELRFWIPKLMAMLHARAPSILAL